MPEVRGPIIFPEGSKPPTTQPRNTAGTISPGITGGVVPKRVSSSNTTLKPEKQNATMSYKGQDVSSSMLNPVAANQRTLEGIGKAAGSVLRFVTGAVQDFALKPVARTILSGIPQEVTPIANAINIRNGAWELDPDGITAKILGTNKLELYDAGGGIDPNSQSLSAAKTLNDAINIGTMATLGGKVAVQGAAASQLAKRTALSTATIDKVSKLAPAATRVGLGGLIGLQFELDEDAPQTSKAVRNSLIGGIAAGAIPPVFGSGARYLTQKTGAGWQVLKPKVANAFSRLEDFATKPGADLLEGRNDALKEVVGDVVFEQTGRQKVAGGLVKAADWLKTRKQMYLDDIAPMSYDRMVKQLKSQGIDIDPAMDVELLALEGQFRRAKGIASVNSEEYSEALAGFVNRAREISPDLPEIISATLLKYDEAARAANGLPVTGGRSADEVAALISAAREGLSEAEVKMLDEVRNYLQTDNIRQLDELRKVGIISEESMKELIAKNPDYIPHEVMVNKVARAFDDADASGIFSRNTKNVQKDLIKKAEGSLREVKDPFQALQIKNQVVNSAIEKQKSINAYLDFVQQFPEAFPKVKGLRTAEEVQLRIGLLDQIKQQNLMQREAVKGIQDLASRERALGDRIVEVSKNTQQQLDAMKAQLAQATRSEVNTAKDALSSIINKLEAQSKEVFGSDGTTSIKNLSNKIAKFTDEMQPLIDEAKTKAADMEAPSSINAVLDKVFTRERKVEVLSSRLKKEMEEYAKESAKILSKNNDAISRLRQSMANVDEVGEAKLRTMIQDEVARLNRQASKEVAGLSDLAGRIRDTRKQLTQVVDQRAKDVNEVRTFISSLKEIRPNALKMQEDQLGVINRYKDGIYETWQVPRDIEVAVKGLNAQQIVGPMRVVVAANRIMRAGATGKNIGFAFPNFFRDVQTAQMTTEQGVALDAIARALFGKDDPKLLKQLKKDGVFFGTNIQDVGISPFQRKRIKILEDSGLMKTVKKIGDAPDMVEEMITKVENAVRYAAVEKAYRAGVRNPDKLRSIAQNSTVNFGKMGVHMKTMNQLIPFLNARVQGTANIFKAFKNNPERFAEMAMWTGVYPEIRLYQHNRDFETYQNIPPYITDNFWVYMIGEIETIDEAGRQVKVPQFISIPKGEAQKLISNPFNHLLKASDNINQRGTGQMLVDTTLSLSPLTFQAVTTEGMLSGLISSFGPLPKMVVGNATGFDTFTGLPIIPEYLEDAPKEFQKKKTTPKATEELANLIGVSPAMLQFNIESLTAGVGRDVMSMISVPMQDDINRGISGTEFGAVSQMPISRSFMRESTDYFSPENVKLREYIQATEERTSGEAAAKNEMKNQIKKDLVKYETIEDRFIRLADMVANEVISPQLAKEVREDIRDALTPTMSQIKGAGVDNFGRAEIIYDYIQDLGEADRLQFLASLRKSKILTDTVARQLRILELYDGEAPPVSERK